MTKRKRKYAHPFDNPALLDFLQATDVPGTPQWALAKALNFCFEAGYVLGIATAKGIDVGEAMQAHFEKTRE